MFREFFPKFPKTHAALRKIITALIVTYPETVNLTSPYSF